MSSAAHSAVAAVPLDSNVEVLERRLLELRAEIDAILMQLTGRKAAPAATGPAAAPEPQEAAVERVSLDLAEQAEPALGAIVPEAEAGQLLCASEPSAIASDAADAFVPAPEAGDTPEASATTEADTPLAAGTPPSADVTLVASIDDATTALADAAAPVVADTTASQTDIGTESVGDAAMLPLASAAAVEPISAEPTPVAAPATDSPQEAPAEVEQIPAAAAASVPASAGTGQSGPAETPVLSFQPRHRKQKAGYAAGPTVSARPRPRLATKIAACILAMLAAATALVVADRTAVGTAQSLPWMSPLPSYVPYGANWPFLGQRQGAGTGSTVDDGAAGTRPSTADDELLMRYRAAWPSGA